MRQRLAEGEHELVRVVDPAAENDRHQLGDGLRPLLAGLEDGHAARLVVGDEFFGAGAQAHERQVVSGQDQHVFRQIPLERFERPQIGAEWVAFRVHRLDADIGRDLGQHLIAAEDEIVGCRIEHHLLR